MTHVIHKTINPGLTAWSSPCWKSFRKEPYAVLFSWFTA